MSKKILFRWLAIVLSLGVLSAACGSDRDDATTTTTTTTTTAAPVDDGADDDTSDDTTTTEPAPVDPCEAVALEATEIGVTEDTIKVIVMADVDNQLAPGLFQGSRDGVEAWERAINDAGGLACRDVEVEFHDSQLRGDRTVEGFLKACDSALALVGTTVLFGLDTDDLTSCADQAGDPIGVPDIAYITTEVPHQCSTTSFHLSRPGAECPYEGGERGGSANIGAVRWLREQSGGDFNGLFLVPADLPSTISSSIPLLTAMQDDGFVFDGVFGVAGQATQAENGPYVQTMRDGGANFVYNGSNDQAMLKIRREAAVQGLDVDSVTWVCSLACYTPSFIEEGGDAAEGVYVWSWFLPFEEADTNEELAKFMDAIDNDFPPAWAAGAWGDGVLFEQAVNAIVDRDGPNGITRAALLEELRSVTEFSVNGWWAPADLTDTNTTSGCFVLLQVQDGAFARVEPAARGEMNCDSTPVAVTVNPDTFTLDG